MIKNQANIYQFVLRDMIGQGVTGLAPTVRIRKDSGSFAATTNTPTEVGNGLYEVALTATECNCDIMAIEVTLPDGQFPAILANEYMTSSGGATPQQIWEYTGGRMVDNTIPSASDNATAVWGAQDKIVTINSTQVETLATATALSAVADNVSAVKAKTDNLPTDPAAVGSAMTLTQAYDAAKTASQFDPATTAVVVNAEQAASMVTATGFATPSDVASAVSTLSGLLNLVLSGMYNWQVSGNTLTIYNSSSEPVGSYTLTKDAIGNIIAIAPAE